MGFTQKQKHTLISIAEWSIHDYLSTGKRRKLPESFEIDQLLHSKQGVFVSVYVKKKLRGCIGTFSEDEPLYKNVNRMALEAAFEDSRFKPVREEELKHLKIEISVLSERRRIKGPEEIIIGRHGIYMIHGIRRATLLPQVAAENRWSPVEFLECCAGNKLGLSRNSWQDAELYVYEAEVFS
jgi:AmmeMemoRadiSam system protein A